MNRYQSYGFKMSLDGFGLFANVKPSEAKRLNKQFKFSRNVEGHGKEVINDTCDEYKGFTWRLAKLGTINLKLGWRTSGMNGKKVWRLKAEGSIHKYARNGYNNDFFSANDAFTAMHALCRELAIDPKKAKITSLEIGVNLPVTFDVSTYLDDNLLRYEGKRKREFSYNALDNNGYVAALTHYWIKLYSKENNILRYELHWVDMQELRDRYSLQNVSDLTPELINRMAEEQLLHHFSQIVFLNNIDLVTEPNERADGMKKKEIELIRNFCLNKYIRQYETKIKVAGTNCREALYKKFQRQRTKAFTLIEQYATGPTKSDLYNQVKRTIEASKEIVAHEKSVQSLIYR